MAHDRASRFSQLSARTAKKHIDTGAIVGGMIPKVEAALSLLESGIDTIAIADARNTMTFISIANGENNYGTLITAR